jgi:hypothetical protein
LGAINCALAAGIWLVSVGHPILGYALQACVACVLLTLLWKADRGLLRALSPGLLLAGAAIAAIVLTQVASSMGAAREVVLGLLVLVGATTVAFLSWMIVSTVRLATMSLRRRGN